MLTTGAVYQWLAEQLYPELTGESAYTVLSRDACNSPVGANGLLLLPHFEGSAAPYWNPLARGLLFNLSLGTTRGEIARATLEGICLEIADNLSILEQVAGPITTLKSAGGLNRVPLFLRVLADSTGKTIRTYSHPDASALGAALSCAVTLNIYADYRQALAAAASEEVNPVIPCGDNVIRYREIMHQRRTLLKALQEALYDS